MSLFYTNDSLYNCPFQIFSQALNANNDVDTNVETFIRLYPELWNTIEAMYESATNGNIEPPVLGDVIWLRGAGNKHVAGCITKHNNIVNEQAVRLCVRSLILRALQLEQKVVAIDLMGLDPNMDVSQWPRIASIIETELEESNKILRSENMELSFIVHVEDKDNLVKVLETLPAAKKVKYSRPRIRLRGKDNG